MIKWKQHTRVSAVLEKPEGEFVPCSPPGPRSLYGHLRVGAPVYITSQQKQGPRVISHRRPRGSITTAVAFTAILPVALLRRNERKANFIKARVKQGSG